MSDLAEAMIDRMPAVLLLSIDFPGLGGPSGIRELRRLSPNTKIIVLTRSANEREELEVLRVGARGYCGPVESDVLLTMVEKVQLGEVWAARKTIGALLEEFYGGVTDFASREQPISHTQLELLTSRELQILRRIASGASNKEIANALNLSISTIKAHLTKIFRKLGQPDRVRLALSVAAAGTLAFGNRRIPEQ